MSALQIETDGVPPESVDLSTSNALEDSEITQPTDGGVSFFESIGSDFRSIATCFKGGIGGVANLVHQTAMSVAAEIAELEREGELNSQHWSEENGGSSADEDTSSLLPWEIRKDSDDGETPFYVIDEGLMEDILSISSLEDTFLKPFNLEDDSSFDMDDARISVIRRLLEIDENLAAMHARLSGQSNVRETSFWKNYFFHCEEIRGKASKGNTILQYQESLDRKSTTAVQVAVEKDSSTSAGLDDSSLVPVLMGDDSSYVEVVPSAPNSLNTYVSTKSLEDMVLVGHEEKRKL